VREVIFVPVAINYDRVLEDTILIKADHSGTRRFSPSLLSVFKRVGRHILLRITRQFRGFGTASVSFGEPLELSKYHSSGDTDLTTAIAKELMQRIANVTPVLGVPLVARHVLSSEPIRIPDLENAVARSIAFLKEGDLPCPRRNPQEIVRDAVSRLSERKLVKETQDGIRVTPIGQPVLTFYANSISHHFDVVAETSGEIAAVAE
jgi:glycerol-3-phosphate O-acyltransferase